MPLYERLFSTVLYPAYESGLRRRKTLAYLAQYEAQQWLSPEALRKLQTDHFDLYQLHSLSTLEDVETAFAADGVMEVLVKAREQGKVRFLGFSAHSEQAALAALEKFDFDTVLFPINFVCWLEGDFGPRLVEKAKSRDMGILALKSLALRRLNPGEKSGYDKCWYRPIEEEETAMLALRFTLSQGVTAAIPPGEAVFFTKRFASPASTSPCPKQSGKNCAVRPKA